MNEKEAERVLHEFYEDNVPESMMDRRLLEAGKAIVPYVLVEIQKQEMPKRRYAIGALEKIGDRSALPVLKSILESKTENDFIRGDALRAIWHIDRALGEDMARTHSGENAYLDRTIQLLREGKI